MSNLYFLHGLHGSGQGVKGTFLKERFPDIICPELPPDIHQRLAQLEKLIQKPALIVGSSLGGLSALLFYQRHPELVQGLLLIAPAVGFFDPSICPPKDRPLLEGLTLPAAIPTKVMAGRQDEVIPLQAIQTLVDHAPDPKIVELEIFEDDHSMNQSLESLYQMLLRLQGDCESS